MPRLFDQKVNGKFPFQYTPAASTDLAKTFARLRKEQEQKSAVVTKLETKRKVR